MDDAVGMLVRLFEDGIPRISADAGSALLGASFEMARRYKVLQAAGFLDTVPCTACDNPGHPVLITWNRAAQHYWANCPATGPYYLAEAAVDLLSFSTEAFLSSLVTAFDVESPRLRCIIPETLWELGTAKVRTRVYTVLVARGLDDSSALRTVLNRLRLGVSDHPVLVVCEARPAFVEQARFRFTFAEFSEVLTLADGEIKANAGAIATLLGDRAQKDKKDGASAKAISRALFASRLADALTAETHLGEAEEIHARWPKDSEAPRRSVSTIKKHIADVHQEYRRANTLGEFRIPKPRLTGMRERKAAFRHR